MEATSKHSHRHGNVLEHTLSGITQALERALFAEEISTRSGLFQSLDPRVKVLSVFALLIAVSFSHILWIIGAIYVLALILALASSIPADFFIKRVW